MGSAVATAPDRPGDGRPADAGAAKSVMLLAQGNKIVATIIAKIVETQGVRVHHVTRGQDALEALLTEEFALALIDANLSDLSGIDVTTQYRSAVPDRKQVPIIGLVSAGKEEQVSACVGAGMDGCLSKPIDPLQLLEAVEPYIALQAAVDARQGSIAFISAANSAREEEPDKPPPMNMQVLNDLEELGGRCFVEEVVSQFITDANKIFPELAQSMKTADVQASRDLLHALRSCAANVGASAIFELCLALREITRDELDGHGEAYLQRLQDSFEEARNAVRDYESVELGALRDCTRSDPTVTNAAA